MLLCHVALLGPVPCTNVNENSVLQFFHCYECLLESASNLLVSCLLNSGALCQINSEIPVVILWPFNSASGFPSFSLLT